MVKLVIAEGGSPDFEYVNRPSGAGPVHQASVRFPSGRTVTFVTLDFPYGPIDDESRVCSADRTVCFPAQP
ncbi:hypothetical protein [Streptomyces sp. Amel2xC10]|uniref:hypothetical protein n=1 Tax=Streptomyces sp. Amel2xC10 TaxID=1305826 RepID=UPI00117DD000|nr:hypothetical protein [Streptomyces sp. Amel2xC10]